MKSTALKPTVSPFFQEILMHRKNRNHYNKSGEFRSTLADIVLVVGWGALIPGLLWLGGAAGF